MGKLSKLVRALAPEAVDAVEGYAARAGRAVRDAVTPDKPRPKYTRRQEGEDIVVRRQGVKPQRVPQAAEAKTIDDLRVILKDKRTNPALRAADRQSRQVRGRGISPDEPMPRTSLKKQAGIGRVYQAAVEDAPGYKHAVFEAYGNQMPEVVERAGAQNLDQLTEAAYRSLGEDVKRQFDTLPVTTRYHSGSGEYPTPSAMIRDVLTNGNLNVFRGGDPHDFLNETDPQTGLTLNEMFRGVHDFYGHVAPGSTFRPGGEEVAYAMHQRTLDPLSQIALLSETRGQNSLVNYSPLNVDLIRQMNDIRGGMEETTKAARMRGQRAPDFSTQNAQLRELGAQWQYAPQKSITLPPEYLDPMTEGGIPDYLKDIIRSRAGSPQERAVHLSHTPGLSQLDPSMYGTGHRGADLNRAKGRDRSHLYLGPEGTVTPEGVVADVSPYAYEAQIGNLYDIEADPERLKALAQAYNLPFKRSAIPDFESLVSDYGYAGYADKHAKGRSAVVYDPVDVLYRPDWKRAPYAQGGAVRG